MKNQTNKVGLLLLAMAMTMASPAWAALQSRLGGLAVYDTDFDITWLADANLAASNSFGLTYGTDLGDHPGDSWGGYTEAILPTGHMNWGGALHWIDAMNAANHLGYDDWRLPTARNQNGTGPCGPAYNCTGSEMGHLFYSELGGAADSSILSATDPNNYLALFTNVQTDMYWSGESGTSSYPNTTEAWYFWTGIGYQSWSYKPTANKYYAWAVRSGDVSAVPLPAAVWLFGSGLVGLGILRRRKLTA